MKKTIAAHMLDIMDEEGVRAVHLGDPVLLDKCCERSGSRTLLGLGTRKRYQRVLNALEQSPFFKKTQVQRSDRPSINGRCFVVN